MLYLGIAVCNFLFYLWQCKVNVAPWPTAPSPDSPQWRHDALHISKAMPVPSNSFWVWRRWNTPNSLSAYFMSNPLRYPDGEGDLSLHPSPIMISLWRVLVTWPNLRLDWPLQVVKVTHLRVRQVVHRFPSDFALLQLFRFCTTPLPVHLN